MKESFIQEDVSIVDAARMCGQGYAWRAGIYDMSSGTFRKSEVLANQLLALDFDGCEHRPEEVVRYAEDIGVPCNFWYFSYSQDPRKVDVSPCRLKRELLSPQGQTDDFRYKSGFNFRLCFVLEREIKPSEYEAAISVLLDAFRKFLPDRSTRDASRLWYGGRLGAECVREDPLGLHCIGALSVHQKVAGGVEPRKAIARKRGFIPDFADVPNPEKVQVTSAWQEMIRGRCRLWDRWRSGDYLDYNERLSLFSNLRYLCYSDTSKSVVSDVLEYFRSDVYQGHTCDEEQVRSKFRDQTLKPVPIVRGRGGELVTMPVFFSDNLGVPVTPDLDKVSRGELDRWMDEQVPRFLSDNSPTIRVLQSQTASGKTHRVISWLLNDCDLTSMKVIYAAPKHTNLIEVQDRFKSMASFAQQGEVKRCPPKEVTARDLLYLQLGLPAKTRSQERNGFIGKLFDPDEKGVFLVTHSLLTTLTGLSPDLVIVDEEIDSSLVKESRLELGCLGAMSPFLERETAQRLVRFISDVKDRDRSDGIDVDLSFLREEVAPQLLDHVDSYISGTPSGLLAVGFFDCMEHDGKLSKSANGMNCIRIVSKSDMIDECQSRGIPIRIFTATPMNRRTEKYFGVEVKVTKAPLARNEGRIVQYRGKSGAKGIRGSNLGELASYIREKLPSGVVASAPLITFKADEADARQWEREGFRLARDEEGRQIHLANNSGLDLFKGKSLIVAGKFDLPHQAYQDLWDDIGDGSELRRQNMTESINGVRQTLYLYTEPDVREMQLQYIRGAVEQAAGRARALRQEGATVYVFCNYVIPDVDEVFD